MLDDGRVSSLGRFPEGDWRQANFPPPWTGWLELLPGGKIDVGGRVFAATDVFKAAARDDNHIPRAIADGNGKDVVIFSHGHRVRASFTADTWKVQDARFDSDAILRLPPWSDWLQLHPDGRVSVFAGSEEGHHSFRPNQEFRVGRHDSKYHSQPTSVVTGNGKGEMLIADHVGSSVFYRATFTASGWHAQEVEKGP